MLNHKLLFRRFPRSFLLVISITILLFSTDSAYGIVFNALFLQSKATVSSPPVILQSGTVASSTIYTNSTSARVSAVAPAPTPVYYPNNYNILSGNWYASSWGYRRRILVNHAQVQANLTDFPVLINQTSDSGLASHAQSNGNDIIFTSSNGVTKLSHEIEKYVSATGALVAWVKVPNLSSSVDTNLYMYYGNPTCSSQQDAVNVWDSNFKGVWHLKEDPFGSAPQMKDSTINGNNGTSSGSMTTTDQVPGKIDGSLDFDGSNDEITCGNAVSLQITTEITIEAWARTSSTAATRGIVNKETSSYNGYQLRKHSDDYYRFATGNPGTAGQYVASDSDYTDSNWHYVVGVRRSGTNYLYIDGVQQTATTTYGITESGANFDIGRAYSNYNNYWWSGLIDEVRVSNSSRSASWIATCYNNQNSPSTFYGVSANEEQNPKVSGTVPTSLQTVDSDYFVVRSTGSVTSTTAYNPSGYNLNGSTTLVSGTTNDLVSNNGAYMTLRSYASATSAQTLYNHQETTTIGGTSYYQLRISSADAAGTTLSASAATTGRKLMGKFVYQLTGVSSIPASTWTCYYRAYRSSFAVAAHGDVDILIRMSDGTVRATIATNVANSGAIGTSYSTVSGTYSWTAYTVVDQTDYLEIDYYIEVTTSSSGTSVYLRIDDNSLATNLQTRAANVYLPSEYTSEVEFTGSSNTVTWDQFMWSTDTAWTAGSVTVTIQVYNYTLGGYPSSGNGYVSYTSSSTANIDEAKTQTIITNPNHFRNGTGYWKIKVKGVKTTTTQFDFKADWVEFKTTYYSEYTVSTEFLFSSMTKNTPTQLNFTVVSEYDAASVSVTIQVWNYSSSAYVTSGEGYLTYASSGSNETKLLSISTNPQFYTSNGNAKIKTSGVKTTTTQYQQKTNQVKLLYKYGSGGDDVEDYVDNNTSDVDSSADKGTHGNFTAQQYRDTFYDTLTEANTGTSTNTGWTNPSANEGNTNWVTPSNMYTSDNSRATTTSTVADGATVRLYNFNFPDLSGNTINGIEVDIEASYSGTTSTRRVRARLMWNGRASQTSYKETPDVTTSDAYYTLGSSSDTWGRSWSPSDFTNANFAVRITSNLAAGTAPILQVDHVRVRIYYSSTNYELDLEVQWTSADYDETTEQLCIRTGTLDSENLKVDVRTGSSWTTVITALQPSQWNNVSVSSYLTGATFTIRFKGSTETSDTTQSNWNIEATLLHTWTVQTYNYVLKIVNQVSDAWKIRLKAYSQSNIGRLKNATIYFRNASDGTSGQIYIVNGAYTQQTGPWYDLPSSPAERYMVVALQATNSEVSYVYVYLEIRVPSQTTYVQYVVTFEIT